jgi:hypothetical protein
MQFRLQFSTEAKELLNNRKQLDPKRPKEVSESIEDTGFDGNEPTPS